MPSQAIIEHEVEGLVMGTSVPRTEEESDEESKEELGTEGLPLEDPYEDQHDEEELTTAQDCTLAATADIAHTPPTRVCVCVAISD